MRFWPRHTPSPAQSTSSFGSNQPQPPGSMQHPRHKPPEPGPLCNTSYLFPPAPCVRPPINEPWAERMQPRDEPPWRMPAEMFRHPLDAPTRKISVHKPKLVRFRERLSFIAKRKQKPAYLPPMSPPPAYALPATPIVVSPISPIELPAGDVAWPVARAQGSAATAQGLAHQNGTSPCP